MKDKIFEIKKSDQSDWDNLVSSMTSMSRSGHDTNGRL